MTRRSSSLQAWRLEFNLYRFGLDRFSPGIEGAHIEAGFYRHLLTG
jgi:hypothetical protein